jgi:hypothetical protein
MRYKLLLLALPVLFVAARPGSTPPTKASTPSAASPAGGAAALAKFNLAPLWRFTGDGSDDKIHNGFFGHGYRRLEFVFTSVQRDEKHLGIYYIQGKDRRYKQVRSFSGTFTLTKIEKAAADNAGQPASEWQPYTATGQFALNEKARPGDDAYGTFRGKLAVDLVRDAKNHVVLNTRTANAATRHGGFLLSGTWTDARTGAETDVLVKNGLAVTYQVLQDFEFGGRSVEINPKYTRVGWDSYWDNQEWWADKPMAKR